MIRLWLLCGYCAAGCSLLISPTEPARKPPSDTRAANDATVADGWSSDGRRGDAHADALFVDQGTPSLQTLPENTALDLGPYTCEERAPGINCRSITFSSRFNYDPGGHRLLIFGGGFSATGRTDVDAFDIASLTWQSLYPSMSCSAVQAADIDPLGFHRGTGHPVARNVHDLAVLGELDQQHTLWLLTTGSPGGAIPENCHSYAGGIAAVARLPLSTAPVRWAYGRNLGIPWYRSAAAEFDPISEMIIVVGLNNQSGAGGLWVYDPRSDEIRAFVDHERAYGIRNNLVYFPPTDKFYLMRTETPDQIVEITLVRNDWVQSTDVVIQSRGPAPAPREFGTGYAYDHLNQVIGGAVISGVFHTFDPQSQSWRKDTMSYRQTVLGPEIGTAVSQVLEYDPINGVYFFISKGGSNPQHLWAYRPLSHR